MRRTWKSPPHLAALAAVTFLAGLIWIWHAQAWDLGRRSPVLGYDAAQYAVAARELAENARLATPFALPIELARHANPPWPLAAVQPGLVLFEALVEKLAPRSLGFGTFQLALREPNQREWLALLFPTLCFLGCAWLMVTATARLLGGQTQSRPFWLALAGIAVAATFLLDPEAQHFAVGGFTELPFTLITLIALDWVARGEAARRPLIFGMVLGLAAAFRANMLILAPLYAVAAAIAAPASSATSAKSHGWLAGRAGLVGRVLLGFALPLAPWWIYKWMAFGTPTWDLTRFVIWDGIEGRSWFSLLHLPMEPEVPAGAVAVSALARKVVSNAPGLLLAFATGPRALWVGALVLWLIGARGSRGMAVAAGLILAQAAVSVLLAAIGIPWTRYLFPARIALEIAGILALWGLIERLARPADAGPSTAPAAGVTPEASPASAAPAPLSARVLSVAVVLIALAWGAWQTSKGNAEAHSTSEARGLPGVVTMRDLAGRLERELLPGEPVMSNLGPNLAWYSRRPVVHLALGPADVEACRRRLPFRHVLLVFRDPDRAWLDWRELLARPDATDLNAEWGVLHSRRWRTADGFLVVWLELGPVRPALAQVAP